MFKEFQRTVCGLTDVAQSCNIPAFVALQPLALCPGVLCHGDASAAAGAPRRGVPRDRRVCDRRGAVLSGPARVLLGRRRQPFQAPAAGRP